MRALILVCLVGCSGAAPTPLLGGSRPDSDGGSDADPSSVGPFSGDSGAGPEGSTTFVCVTSKDCPSLPNPSTIDCAVASCTADGTCKYTPAPVNTIYTETTCRRYECGPTGTDECLTPGVCGTNLLCEPCGGLGQKCCPGSESRADAGYVCTYPYRCPTNTNLSAPFICAQ
jgi:hypothetical protein